MSKKLPKYPRVLGVAPSTRGFGFALIEGLDVLADWGVKSVSGDKNKGTTVKMDELLHHYQPDILVLEDTLQKPFRRSARIRALTKQLVSLAKRKNISVLLFSREQVRKTFLVEERGNKHTLARILADKFPEELGFRLPPKRRPWMSEDHRMHIFDALALALLPRQTRRQ